MGSENVNHLCLVNENADTGRGPEEPKALGSGGPGGGGLDLTLATCRLSEAADSGRRMEAILLEEQKQ